ncbi:hypothetical protein [Levilactobacillus andaensis]|uniref:hypothetical protein n=1 Tax=Levilactobacillus andaensis TaxID=2799570 RepID=UPI0019444D75|nr:hypothetical protein [Levilactobacillus andaensis]
MLIDDNPKIHTITPAQITKVFYPYVIAKTEAGSYVNINLSEQERKDPLFWESIASIAKAKLWVPIGERFHQLLSYDWTYNAAY